MDEQNKKSIIPNTTQVPNFVLDELLPTLSDVELRIVLIVTRQTLGWVEDKETGAAIESAKRSTRLLRAES